MQNTRKINDTLMKNMINACKAQRKILEYNALNQYHFIIAFCFTTPHKFVFNI